MYLNVGEDIAIDESSIACQSKYGHELIFFNSSKPTGKYHFHAFLANKANSYAILCVQFHTRNRSNLADGFTPQENVNESGDNDDGSVESDAKDED